MKWFYKIYYNMINDGPPYCDNWGYYGHSNDTNLVKEFVSQRNMALYQIERYPADEARDYLPNGFKEDEELRLIPLEINENHDMLLVSMTMWEYRDISIDYRFPDILFDPKLDKLNWFIDWKRVKPKIREALDILLYTSVYEKQNADVYPREDLLFVESYFHTPLGRHICTRADVFKIFKEDKFFRFSKTFNYIHFNRLIR